MNRGMYDPDDEVIYEEEEDDPEIWVTRDGTRIPMQEMSDQHLSNATKHLQKKLKTPQEKVELENMLVKIRWLEIEQERREK